MARVATDAAGAAPLTGDENDPKMQMTILPRVFGQQGKIQSGVFRCYYFSFSNGKLLPIPISFWISGKCLDSL
jgi:hypothetical protein